MANNRQRGFQYERLAAKFIQKLFNKYGKPNEIWWAYRIPLSSGVMIIQHGNRVWMPGDVIIGCVGFGVQTIEVKSASKKTRTARILKYVKCPFLLIHQHRQWQFWYRSFLPHNHNPNGWHQVEEKEFMTRLMQSAQTWNNGNHGSVVLVPGTLPQIHKGIE